MNTLTTPIVARVLAQLLAEEDALATKLDKALADLPLGEIEQQLRSKTDYPDLYGRLRDFPLAVSSETGRLLYMLARACKAHTIIEFGTSFGFSTLHLAAALRDNGGGQLISTELVPAKAARARDNLTAAGLLDLVKIREGDALQTLDSALSGAIDLVLLDGAKGLYAEILGLLEPRLRAGAQIVADDANASPEYLAYVRAPESGYLSYSLAGGVELSVRLG